jgi:hypothetical protein
MSSGKEKLTKTKGRLPALGWNSWNAFSCDIDFTKILTAANQVVSLGLKDVGYEYIKGSYIYGGSSRILTETESYS